MRDKRLARIMRQVRDLPGQELFQHIDIGDDGEIASISSQDVNAYLRETANDDFTAKDFRTGEGTLALALASERCETKSDGKLCVVAAIKAVSERLGYTPAVCKKSCIHPGVIGEFLAKRRTRTRRTQGAKSSSVRSVRARRRRIACFGVHRKTRRERPK